MELALFFYLAGITESVSDTARAIAILGGGMLTLATILTTLEDKWHKWPKRLYGTLLFTWVFSVLVLMFTPNKETMYTMAAAYGVQTVAENPNVQRVAGKSLQVLESKLDEFLKEEKK